MREGECVTDPDESKHSCSLLSTKAQIESHLQLLHAMVVADSWDSLEFRVKKAPTAVIFQTSRIHAFTYNGFADDFG